MPITHRHRHRRRRSPSPQALSPHRIAQGEHGERLLQDWLDRSRLPYLYLDQTPLTIPLALRSQIKRPDFLVALPDRAPVAVDAKAKAPIEGCFVLDDYERRTLANFEAWFQIPVWYACFPPADPSYGYLFRNGRLMGSEVGFDPKSATLHVPLALGLATRHFAVPFAHAFMQADGLG